MKIDVRKVTLTDIELLQAIAKQTFIETFATENSEENMRNYLADSFSIAKITEELNNINSVFYFAQLNTKVIGYLKINTAQAQTELKHEQALEIERIYVLKEFYGKQIGQLLYNTALQLAQAFGCNYLWLGVWEHNERAINFYTKNNFVAFDKHIFKLGDDEQTDILMKLQLNNNSI
ncbi:MAG: GNAT family N-acetyltransferase [Bacteroidia bacterium]